MDLSTFSLNYNAFHKYKYYSNYNNNNVNNRKIIAKYLLSEYFNIKRNKRRMWSNYWLLRYFLQQLVFNYFITVVPIRGIP